MVTLPKEEDVDMELAKERFGDTEARNSLVLEARDAAAKALSIHDLKRAVQEGRPLSALGDGNVVPFRAVQLYRSLLARQSLGYSQMARAARTEDDLRRQIGDFEMNVIVDDDAVFLMIEPVNTVVPSTLTLIHDDGRMKTLKLPEPINAVQQLGFPIDTPETDEVLALLQDPATSIFIG